MIVHLTELPSNMVGFSAEGRVTKEDFTSLVIPRVQELVDRQGELNYLLILKTPLNQFTFGSWIQDALLGVKHLFKWNRAAIVSDKEGIRSFTDLFGKVMPGEFKGFDHSELEKAVAWTSGRLAEN